MRLDACRNAIAVGLLVIAPTVGQAQALPTDLDLRTAYCARVLAAQSAEIELMLAGTPEGSPVRQAIQRDLRERAAALHRLRSYLLPKVDALATEPLIAAALRADSDLDEMKRVAGTCTTSCSQHLDGGSPTSRWSLCTEECLSVPLVARLRGCRSPDWLPF